MGMQKHGATEDARRGQRLIIGPWQHGSRGGSMAGSHYFGVAADAMALGLDEIHLRWYSQWLKGEDTGLLDEPPVKIFVMGDDVWRDENEWPLARAQNTNYYLHSGGNANSLHGDGSLSPEAPSDESPDGFLYNPANPVPTRGGQLCCNPYFAANGAYDQNRDRGPPRRTGVLDAGAGPRRGGHRTDHGDALGGHHGHRHRLYGQAGDVCEDGCARNLTDGIIRARYRESMSNPSLLEPGRAYCYTIDLWATSNVFKAGHQIRLEVSSSNFPRFDRNTNTGGVIAADTELKPAIQTILHDSAHPSHVTLPIVPR